MTIPELPNVKLSKEPFGANIFLSISSEKSEDIERFFNFLVNYAATPEGCELEWIGENFAKLQLNEERLIAAFELYYSMYNEYTLNMPEKQAKFLAVKEARIASGNIQRDHFLKEAAYDVVVGSSAITKNGKQIKF